MDMKVKYSKFVINHPNFFLLIIRMNTRLEC